MSIWGIVVWTYLALVAVPLCIIDFREHRLPNKLVVPGMALALLCSLGEGFLGSGAGWMPLIGALVYFAFMLLLSLLGGLGMGDVKLAFVIGAAAGFLSGSAVFVVVALAFVIGGMAALIMMILRRRGRMAFGPYMLAGAIAVGCFATAVPRIA